MKTNSLFKRHSCISYARAALPSVSNWLRWRSCLEDVAVDAHEILVAVGGDHLFCEVSGLEIATHVDASGQVVAGVVFLEPATHPAQTVLVDRRTEAGDCDDYLS